LVEPQRRGRPAVLRPALTGLLACLLCAFFCYLFVQILPGKHVRIEPLGMLARSPSGRFVLLMLLLSQVFLALVAAACSIVQLLRSISPSWKKPAGERSLFLVSHR
jgi:hypothetical protein